MKQLISDLKNVIKNNWKFLLIVFIVILFILNYTELKSGIIDGWKNK